jgi:cytidine deaminase
MKEETESLLLFSLSFLLVVTLGGRFRRNTDSILLQRAHQLRRSLCPPKQSNFRVVAVLLLENGSCIYGTNDEPVPLSGAICAERAALLQYRIQQTKSRIKRVYIVTDADKPVPPGTACREFMQEYLTRDTLISIQSADETSPTWNVTLAELYPYPSIYTGMKAAEQVTFGQDHKKDMALKLGEVTIPGMTRQQVALLIKAAQQASQRDSTVLHPICYGAAMAVKKSSNTSIEIIQACQVKALEYSSSQDAICNLSSLLHGGGGTPVALVQVDQFGIPHAPFSPARSYLVEYGIDCPVILADANLMVQIVRSYDLAPHVPLFQ